MAVEKIKRSQVAHFLNTAAERSPEQWSRINKGVSELAIAYNPEVTTEKYIGDDNASSELENYAPNAPVSMKAYKGDPVFDFVNGLRKSRATGEDCKTQLLNVDIFDTSDSSTYYAEKQDVIVQIDTWGGDASATLEFTLVYSGDPVVGTAKISQGNVTFSDAAAAA